MGINIYNYNKIRKENVMKEKWMEILWEKEIEGVWKKEGGRNFLECEELEKRMIFGRKMKKKE